MTTAELHEILDDENRKLTADELKEVVYQLKQDCNTGHFTYRYIRNVLNELKKKYTEEKK